MPDLFGPRFCGGFLRFVTCWFFVTTRANGSPSKYRFVVDSTVTGCPPTKLPDGMRGFPANAREGAIYKLAS